MELLVYIIIFGFFILRTELKPIDQSVTLKLPINIESGMSIILQGMLYNEHDQLSLTFSGDNMNAEDEWHVTYIPQKKHIYLIHDDIETLLFRPKLYPERFLLQFSARTVADRDQHIMELYYEESENDRQPSEGIIDLPSFQMIEYIYVKGFSNVHNVTFTFDRQEINT